MGNVITVENGSPPSRIKTLSLISFGHFINDGMVFFIPVTTAILAKQHGAPAALITAVLTLFYLSTALFGLVVGRIADRVGRRGVLIALGIFILSLGLGGFYLALLAPPGTGADVLAIVGAIVAGIGSSFYHPLGGSVIQLAFDKRSMGKVLGINGAFGSLGRALYPSVFFLVAALSISQTDTVAIFALIGIVSATIIGWGLAESLGRGRRWSRITVLAPSGASDISPASLPTGADTTKLTSDGNSPNTPEDSGDGQADERPAMRHVLNKNVIALTVIAFFRSMAFIGIVSWVPIYLTTQKHLGISSHLGYTVTLMYAGGVIGQPLFGQLVDRFDKRLVLSLNSLFSAASIIAYIATSGAASLVALLFFGFFTFAGFPLLLSLVSDYVPKGSSSTGNALVWGLGSTGGQAMGPLVVGLLTLGSYSHLTTAFAVMAGIAALTVLGMPLLAKSENRTKMPLFG